MKPAHPQIPGRQLSLFHPQNPSRQLSLFESRPQAPQWHELPAKVRQEALQLLSVLLTQSQTANSVAPVAEEVSDE